MSYNGEVIDGASIGGAAALDEAEYQLWLRDPSAPVAHLVEQDYNDTSAVYPNWVTHTIKSSDWADLSFTGYPARIKSIGNFTRQIGERFTDEVTASIGEIEYGNAAGRLDLWHKLSIDGQKVRVYHGHPSWARERFRILYEAVSEQVSSSTMQSLKVSLLAPDYKYNLPIQTNLIGTAAPNASANLPVPKAAGRVFNIEPACIDLVNQVYQWNDGAVTSVSDARDTGVSFKTAQIAISAVNSGTDVLSTATAHGFVANTRVRSDIGSFPNAANWQAMACNESVFVSLASNTAIGAWSIDGLAWNQIALPVSAFWNDVKWGGNVFCAISTGSAIAMTSPDGITWTQRAMPSSALWKTIDWNGSTFCAVATSSTTSAISADGITWTAITLPFNDAWTKVIWNGTYFYLFGGTGYVLTSTNGVSWGGDNYTVDSPGNLIVWTGICFISVTYSLITSNVCSRSVDGIIWVNHTLPSALIWTSLEWSGTTLCVISTAASTVAATSVDGITWTARTLPASSSWSLIRWNGTIFCAIAAGATYATVSTDGISWTAVTGTLPAPLAQGTDYWVSATNLTTTNFSVSATRGGTVIDITNTTTGGVLIGFHWTADLTNGKVYLDQKPAGKFTLDGVAGSTDVSTIVVNALSAVNVDPASQRRFQAICAQPVGIYIKDRRNRIDVAKDVIASVGAWYGHSRDGLLQFGRVEGNPASYDQVLVMDDMWPTTLQIEPILPEKKHRCSYRKNWTNQAGALAAAVSTNNVTLFSNDYSVSQPLGSTDVGANGSFHAMAIIPDVQETLMALGSDAATEAARLDAMYFGMGAMISVDARRVATEFDIGQVVNVNHTRFGIGNGVTKGGGINMTLVYIDTRSSEGKVSLKFFVAFSAYTPGQL